MKSGLVIKSTGSRYKVLDNDGAIHNCVIKGKFRVDNLKSTNPVAVGDRVLFEEADNDVGVIKEISERKNYIIRKSSNLSKQSQVIAANIDIALLIVSLKKPETPLEFIDRFLVSAEAYRIPVHIIFNKTDIYSEKILKRVTRLTGVYEKIGYRCHKISVKRKENLGTIKKLFLNKIALLSGNSGVGKSSLLNEIEPSLRIKTREVSDYHERGKHTTTFAEMYPLSFGGYVIDTPGIKGFGLTGMVREEISHFFPEIFRLSSKCRYYNCLHLNEPGCAIHKALEKGGVEWSRYRSYLNIIDDDNSRYR